MKREHTQVVHTNCQTQYCPICEGGLGVCSVCGCIEGATTSECPGEKLTADRIDEIYVGTWDFIDGEWKKQASPHSPASYKKEAWT